MGLFDNHQKQQNTTTVSIAPNQSLIQQVDQKCLEASNAVKFAISELGRNYYEKNKENTNSEYSSQISDIRSLIEKETLWNQYRLSLEGKTLCEHCGAIITSDSAFCNKCGGSIKPRDFSALGINQAQPSSNTIQNVCPACGSPLTEGAAFCEKCGQKL
jgi:ribosomal protein L40E